MEENAPVQSEWAIFLDFDGTLVELADRPDGIVVPPDLMRLLDHLRAACGGALAIVTGRAIAVIDGFLPGLDLDVCGLHGMERRVSGRVERLPVHHLREFQTLAAETLAAFTDHPGIVIENKGESVALHWRQAPEAERALRLAADRLAEVEGFRVQEGKALVEVVPNTSGKGHAIEALMTNAPYHGRRALFIGDDVTDEHAFPVVNALGGLTVKVGDGPTAATKRLSHPAAVRDWLQSWIGSSSRLTALEDVRSAAVIES